MMTDTPDNRTSETITTFVDAHVHLHDCYGISEFFEAASRNFRFFSSTEMSTATQKYVLCLTEARGANKFEDLARRSDRSSADPQNHDTDWNFRISNDDDCLIASHPTFGDIAVIAGRQIVTAEKLEVLALGSRNVWEDGILASDVIESVIATGAIPVLPWGFGKWSGRRRQVLVRLIERFGDASLYLGDNSGRLGMLPDPREFAMARDSGMRILRGSDPLPFAAECDRVGSFGFYVDNLNGNQGIWSALRTMLRSGAGRLNNYGLLESPFRFVRNQVAMQYAKRLQSRRAAN